MLESFIAGLPKVELHVHHIGSASPHTVARLAQRHAGSTPVPDDPELLADYFQFTDFAHFVEVYLSVVDLVRDAEDVATLTYDIALEVCPTSNVCTRSVPSLAEHPLPALIAAGVPVTINSDDPPMFSTTLNGEYAVAARLLDLDRAGVAELARQGVRYSFLETTEAAALLAEIDEYAGASEDQRS